MTKMKKLFAVVLALAMLFTMASFSASADAAPTVTVSADKTSVEVGDTVQVTVALTDLGGVDGTLTYNKSNFTYKSATFTDSINTTNNNLKNNGNGTLRLILVKGTATLTFEATAAIDNAEFSFELTAASNETGTAKVTEVTCTPATVTVVKPAPVPFVLGTQLRQEVSIDKQDLGFAAKIDNIANGTVTELGFIVIPTALLQNAGVSLDQFTAENEAIKDKVLSDGISFDENNPVSSEEYIGYIKGIANNYDLMGKSFTARYYIKIEGSDEKIYSTNVNTNVSGEEIVTSGTTKNSVVKLLGSYIREIAENNPELEKSANTVINNYNASKDDASKQALLDFVADYEESLIG